MDILNQFGINPLLLAAQVVNFCLLLFILKKLLYKPILKVLDERKKRIEDSLKNAEEIERKLALTEEEKEKILAKTSADAQKMLDETKKEITAMKAEGRQQVEQQASDIMRETKEVISLEKERMLIEVRKEIGRLVASIFPKVTGKSLSKEDQKKIIEKEVKNLS